MQWSHIVPSALRRCPPRAHLTTSLSCCHHQRAGTSSSTHLPQRAGRRLTPVVTSFQPKYTPRQRISAVCRYGADPFLGDVAAQFTSGLCGSSACRGTFSQPPRGDTNDSAPMPIEAHEVAILQPEVSQQVVSRTVSNSDIFSIGGQALPYQQRQWPIGYCQPHVHRTVVPIDESEGGTFDLVEPDGETWVWDRRFPGPSCVRDPFAAQRLDAYCQRTRQATFVDCVRINPSTEPTLDYTQCRGGFRSKEMTWYTASLPLPETNQSRFAQAVGKARTVYLARDLCAMHAELVLCAAGIALVPSIDDQVTYDDACLLWGRPAASAPPTAGDACIAVPKPLKEWVFSQQQRLRFAPLNVTEKLLCLNRRVVQEFRQHLTEVNLTQDETIAEMATLAVSCVRIFLRAQQHPYEGAYFNFVYQCNSQYRCSIYLPLPERFGVRGGLAMASTPPRAQQLCALHAIEVLCTLNCVPASCRRLEKWQRLLSLREKMGLSVPDEVGVSSPDARSPPSYREVSGPACTTLPSPSDIWRVMRIDADTFDVCPIAFLSSLSEGKTGICWHTATRDMVLASLAYHAGWSEDDLWRHTHHYCGLQNFRGKPRPSANTFWVELPLDPKTYGRRVACGRCVTRAGAIRHLYIHILRTLHALRACPWEVLAERELLTTIYKGNWARMKLHMAHWPGLRDNVLAIRPADERAAVDAEVVSCNYAEALSPHPVMSDKLARLTFTF